MTPLHFDYPISVAILYFSGGKQDDEDTLESVVGIEEALEKRGHMVRKMAVTKKNWRKAVRIPGDVVFNLVEDEDWDLYVKVGQRLEQLGRAQVGHDMKCFKYATRKAWVKKRMARLGIFTPNFRTFNRRSKISQVRGLEYPLIVKPSRQHAGIGISQDSVVIDQQELEERVKFLFRHYRGEVIAEEFVDGREIHVTVLGNGRHVIVLPYCELGFGGEFKDNWDVYTYDAKWDKQSWEYWAARVYAPAKVTKRLDAALEKLAVKAYKAFGCRDIARIDIRVNAEEKPMIVDVNMNPSLNYYDEQDATLKSVYALDWSYEQFIETIVVIAYKRKYRRLPDRIRERHLLLTT